MSSYDQIRRAIHNGDCDEIRILLANRDVNAGTGDDNLLRSALMGITHAPNPRVVQLLIELGVNVNAVDRYGCTPLHYAARNKDEAADPSVSTACAKLLIEAGANVNAEDKEGVTPLHQSILNYPWNMGLFEILLAAGANGTKMFLSFMKAVAGPDKRRALELLAKYDIKLP